MKKAFGVTAVVAVLLTLGIFLGHEVSAQTKAKGEMSEETQLIIKRLDKIQTQLETILDNQEKMFAELRRGRYFTTHRA